jgi:ketosteroid isomerase-like protein
LTTAGVGSAEPAGHGLDPVEGIHRVFAAFGGGDARALFEVIHEDAVWVVNGTVPVAQRYEGRERIFDLFRETRRLTDGTYFSELRWALADGDHAVAVYRATGRRLGRELDIDQVLLIRHRDGRWLEIVAVPTDPPEFERFWAD